MRVSRSSYRLVIAAALAALSAVVVGRFGATTGGWPSGVLAEECVLGQGYWKNHASAWPVSSLVLGNAANPAHAYIEADLLQILGTPARGDASIILAYQLIAAKLNVAHGSNLAPIAAQLADADRLLGGYNRRLPDGVTSSSANGSAMVSIAAVLDDYNNGRIAGACGGGTNVAPVANAGSDRTVTVGATVHLDGSASSDADGNALTFHWSFASKPANSAATLSSATDVGPVFIADAPGTYIVQLIVNDGQLDSAPDTVQVSTVNSRPVANAGLDQSVPLLASVQLDGQGSNDPDGDALTFAWTFTSKPQGSGALLSDPAAVHPTFTVDLPGEYTLELVVSDGTLSSTPDSVTISTVNSAPRADAGADITVRVPETVTLDGSGSTDADGDPLSYRWSFVSRPAASQAVLSDPASVKPSFVVDTGGTFVVQLIVNDGHVDSVADTVMVSTSDQRPVANAGPDAAMFVGDLVRLDGSASTDIDGDPLSYRWALIVRPTGSAATLSDPLLVKPTFVIDVPGDYIAQLIVNDGTFDSVPDTVTITSEVRNRAPLANAGTPQTVALGSTVQLNGTASSDADGDPLSYKWSLLSVPATSTAVLSDASIASPTFTADVAGSYVAQLVVNDGHVDSAPASVIVSTLNSTPVANAGPDQSIATGSDVQLDGSASFDPDGAQLLYTWSLLSVPDGSSAALVNPASPSPTFTADLDGVYVAQLIVGDGALTSSPDTVTVSAQQPVDLALSFFNTRTSTSVGDQIEFFLSLQSLGGAADGVKVRLNLPPGVSLVNASPTRGSFDAATGVWDVGAFDAFDFAILDGSFVVQPTGPYELTADVVSTGVADADPSNNVATLPLSVNTNAELGVRFTLAPGGTLEPGATVLIEFDVQNDGPSTATGVSIDVPVPPGLKPLGEIGVNHGTYDLATGVWTIPSLQRFTGASWIAFFTLNPTGAATMTGAITASSQPDPNPANNVATAPAINRRPVANAGPDQAVAAHAVVNLDGSQTFDPEGDPVSLQWSFAMRPANSGAAIVNPTSATPTFVPDLGGTYVLSLVATDNHGATSVADTASVSVTVLNSAPVIRSGPLTQASVATPYEYRVRATDPDAGDVLTFTLAVAPDGMIIDAGTGVIAWAPGPGQGGVQSVTVRVQDAGGLAATQNFAIQVSSAANHAPAAQDDAYQVRVNESLGVGTPGVLANDTDEDGNGLTVRLITPPVNGALSLSPDGSFTYTPYAPQGGAFVLAENIPLTSYLPGVTATASRSFENGGTCSGPPCAIDDKVASAWYSFDDAPVLDVAFPQDVTVAHVHVVSDRTLAFTNKVTSGILQLLDGTGAVVYDSGNVEFPGPSHDVTFELPGVEYVRLARLRITSGSAGNTTLIGIAEFKVIGSTLMRRERVPERNLAQLLPTRATTSSELGPNVADAVVDDTASNWYANTTAPGQFVELTFPSDVTVTGLELVNASATPDGFGSSLGLACTGTIALFDAAGASIYDSGIVQAPSGFLGAVSFTGAVPNVAGVRRARYTTADCTGTAFPPGLSEFRVFGSAAADDAPAIVPAKKFQSLQGREAHSTPIVVNLSDDNADGVIDTNDVPDILVPVESASNQLAGEILVISGDDGRLLFTAGSPDLVSPWSEAAAADLDGDGAAEIVAVHADGNHLIAFDHTGAVRWVSDANPMPQFTLGERSVLIGGSVSIADLNGDGRPEIVVGASVFDADGHLLGDGRLLGGTTAGTGLRSAASAVADVDLDGVPEIIAGPTAYRMTSGALTKVWQRTDRADGYVGVANLDDDPQGEVVVVANGSVYALNHDGSDLADWNAPSHSPVGIPGGGQGGAPLIVDVDGDGRPEIGVAGATRYVVFSADGSVRWASAISDRSSNATGAVAFDLDGDGAVEIIYRDEFFLRVFRGSDGLLLAKLPIGSATWGEEPVVADVDNDGHADIVVSSDLFSQPLGRLETGIFVLQDIANKWTRTRRIWNQHAYHVTNVRENGTIPAHETPHWLAGLNAFRVNQVVPGESTDGVDRFTYAATDGSLESNTATVRIAVRAPNSAPAFESTPLTHAAHDVLYLYAARASDADAGDILTYSLVAAPTGMTIDGASGVISWTPTAGQVGIQDVIAKVRDVRGLSALQSFAVTVADGVTVPDVVGQVQSAAEGAIVGAQLSVGATTTRHSPTVAAAAIISQTPSAGALVAPATVVDLVVSLGPAPVGTVPDVVGQTQTAAQADIVAAGFVLGPVAGLNSATVPLGVVISQTPAGGGSAESGSAISLIVSLGPPPGTLDVDHDGFTGDAGDCNDTNASIHPGAVDTPGDGIDQDCNGRDAIAGDDTAPTALIDSPVDGTTLTLAADVTGTATDANFLRYTLSVGRVNDEFATMVVAGRSPVASGVLGRLDPTLLENGLYRLRLTAEDINGHVSVDERVLRVDGEAKVGVLNLAFLDLEMPVTGVPITVLRTYDSRVKSQRDFGVGWTLQIRSGTYQNNRRPGDGWQVSTGGGPFGLPCAVVSEPRSHLTELRISDREYYLFRPRLTNLATVVGGCVGTVAYEAIGGSKPGATLRVIGNADVIYTSGDTLNEFDGSSDTERVFDPERVRLTTIDGRVVDFDRRTGVTRVADAMGNVLTVNDGGIVHSSGKSVAFTRDSAGRILSIVDPDGRRVTYAYDENGDLISATDRAAHVTTFAYDARHNLLRVDDPLGNRALQTEFDADGRLVAVVDANGGRVELVHDLAAREEVVRDRLGRVTTHRYDEFGNIVTTIDALGRTHQFTYDASGNQLTETDPLGRVRSTTYDAFGNPLSRVDFDGNTTAYAYDARGQLIATTDATGRVTRQAYDANGNIIKETDSAGRVTEFTIDRSGNTVSVLDPLGNTVRHEYNASGDHLLVSDGRATTSFAYDGVGNAVSRTDARTVGSDVRQLVTRFDYDASGLLSRQTDALDHVTRIVHDALGSIIDASDAAGTVTHFDYDAAGQLTTITFADGSSETYTYDADGRRTSATDRDGHTTSYERPIVSTASGDVEALVTVYPDGSRMTIEPDVLGRAARVVDERGNETRFSYAPNVKRTIDSLGRQFTVRTDGAGRATENLDALGHSTRYDYDAAGRLAKTTYPDGSIAVRAYDAGGRLIAQTDEQGLTTKLDVDSAGRLIRVTDPASQTSTFARDEAGNVVGQTDANGHTTLLELDALGRTVKRVRPMGQAETFAYDANGNVTTHVDFNDQTTRLTYDRDDRLTRKTFADGSAITYTYTPSGRRRTAGAELFTYDARGRVVNDRNAAGEEIAYAYDAAGNRTSVTSPAGTTTYTYDALNRMASVIDAHGTTSYTYDEVGNLATTTYPNGVVTAYTYDARNRLVAVNTSTSNGLIASYAYETDAKGRRTRVVETGPGTFGRTVTYEYDAASRLIRESIDAPGTINDADITYTYDGVGNRLRKTTVQGTASTVVAYVYDANDRLVSETTSIESSTASAGADASELLKIFRLLAFASLLIALALYAGTLTPQTGFAIAFHRFVTVGLIVVLAVLQPLALAASAASPTDGQAPQPDIVTHAYDDNGNLVSRSNGTVSDTFVYDAENHLIAATVRIGGPGIPVTYTYDADGVRTSKTINGITTEYLVDKSGELPQVLLETTGNDVVQYTYGNDLISQTGASGAVHFYQYDGHHSTRQLTDVTGAVTDRYDYDAFGNELLTLGATANVYRYAGQQWDPNVGFYYMRARYYMQAQGRFLTTDPQEGTVFDPPSLHRYLYASADPVNNWDPSGEETLMEQMTSLAINGVLQTLRLVQPVLNLIGSVGSRALGNALLERFALRFAGRLGEKTVETILLRSGLGREAARRLAGEAFGKFIQKKGLELVQRGAVKTAKKIFTVLFFLFAGDKARAETESHGLAPQDDGERVAVAGVVVFAEDEQPFVSPRFRRVYNQFVNILDLLL